MQVHLDEMMDKNNMNAGQKGISSIFMVLHHIYPQANCNSEIEKKRKKWAYDCEGSVIM